MKNQLLIIDGSALLTKCYYGNLPMEYKKASEKEKIHYEPTILHNKNGIFTNAIYSFMKALEKIICIQQPSHLAITFDKSRNTFRRALYQNYKGHRKETENPLKMQKEIMPQLLTELGICVFISNDTSPETTFEGDDLIGSLCNMFCGQIPITILTNDHDMMQLVKPGINMWLDVRSSDKANTMFLEYTQGESGIALSQLNLPDGVFPFGRESVKWEMGVYPELVAALKGLSGDASDNIPGVKGVSDKTATVLLNYYGSIDAIFKGVLEADTKEKETILKEKWKEIGIGRPSLKPFQNEEALKLALLSQTLATIVCDLEFPITLPQLSVHVNLAKRQEWYTRFGFKSLLYPNQAA